MNHETCKSFFCLHIISLYAKHNMGIPVDYLYNVMHGELHSNEFIETLQIIAVPHLLNKDRSSLR